MVNIYADEAKAQNNSFRIYSVIWGNPADCADYEREISELIESNRNILGNDFNGFHASRLNMRNWNTIGEVYRDLILKFVEYKNSGRLNSMTYLESKIVYTNRMAFDKAFLKTALEDRTSGILNQFPDIQPDLLPVIYGRFEYLYLYFLLKDQFGAPREEFSFFPDSTGKVLRYIGTTLRHQNGTEITFLDFMTRLANAVDFSLDNIRNRPETRNLRQRLVHFEPMRDQSSFLIQTCDILVNFCYNAIRYLVGRENPIYREKGQIFLAGFNEESLEPFRETFELHGGHAVSIDDNLQGSIQ